MSDVRTVAVIPARYASTRFPGKPLVDIAGKTMIQRVYERTAAARTINEVLVATDDERIRAAVHGFGGRAVMTSAEHQTGTDRIAQAIQNVAADLVVNVQGDEPLIPPEILDNLVETMCRTEAPMGTVAVPFNGTGRNPMDENAVKVVVDADGYALYFSRAAIPFWRAGGARVEPLLHWGLYAYRRPFLEQFVRWPQGRLEACEMLEQLRALEHGVRILVIQASETTMSVDVPADVDGVLNMLSKRGEI